MTDTIATSTTDTTPAVTTTPVVPEVKKEPEMLSPQFAALQKEEKRIRAEREALKEVKAQKAELDKILRDAKANPTAALEKLGLTIDDIVTVALNNGKPTPELTVKALKDEIDSFKAEQEKARQDAEAARLTEQESDIQAKFEMAKNNMVDAVKAEADKYELINALNLNEQVWIRIYNHAVETQAKGDTEILTVEQVAEGLEKELEQYAEKLMLTKKLKAKLSVVTPEPISNDSAISELLDQAKVRVTKKTLTNTMLPASTTPDTKPKTDADRRKAAEKIMEALKTKQ